MNAAKQKLLLQYLLSSPDTFALCKSIVKADYFAPEYRKTVDFFHEYYDKYSALPTTDMVEAETGVLIKYQQVTRDQINFCCDEIEAFCRRKAFEAAIYAAAPLIDKGDFATIETMVKDALLISLNKDLGVNYFEDPAARLEDMLQMPPRVPTLWGAFDDAIGGGLARTELLLVTANSGGGKSITLANLAVNMVEQGLDVLYISLELSEVMVSQRFDTLFTSVPTVNWRNHYQEMGSTLLQIGKNAGQLVIKHMGSGTNSNAIRAYLKEYELKYGKTPDLLVVDYLDLMGANEKVSADNIWEKDKRATEQLRDILFDYDMMGATASQQNRAALETDNLHQGHIAGGISKVNTVDIHASIILTPTMKAAGEMMIKFLKTRSSGAEGLMINLAWNNTTLRITNAAKEGDKDIIIDKLATQSPHKKSLLELMNV
jgi:KaiC/GvpD/RAD55 family RecA-like ATPase